ncbi:MAG: Eco29kI family restriction endonuclease [Verrucomicrobia bacterium]|nr:Eco29kI family restriction endonuclease [Verrucomicrobiota bacterium]MBU1908564.1 Eco29kI family restriction endonuclease [Verrucomicrobiota bacterium]
MSPEQPRSIPPFNPLDKTNLGESVAEAVLQQPIGSLPPDAPFIGAGIYAIYYEGDFPLYKDVAEQNRDGLYRWPIYVGKAVPAGARKGGYGLGADPGQALFKRLAEHAASIEQAKNLNLADFRCRFLVVDDIWIPLAESLLIEMFSPLWNRKIDGFGNHDPGSGRHQQQRSPWDVIHPGRPWAVRLQPPSADEHTVREGAAEYLTRTKIKILARQDALDEE